MKFLLRVIFVLLFFSEQSHSQFSNNIWCFGDSAGINWSDPQNPVVFASSVLSRGGSVSIYDTISGAFVYANGTAPNPGPNVKVWNKYHTLMQNGTGLSGLGWYHELTIVPYPVSDSLLLLFGVGVAGSTPNGLYYSIINYKAYNDSGAVIQKNIQLLPSPAVDALAAIKHGNGRDWWLIFQRWDNVSFSPNNDFFVFLIDPTGITILPVQNIGSMHTTNLGCVRFNKEGNQFANVNIRGLLELYDFDRCTGIISNPVNVEPEDIGTFPDHYSSCEFSPDGSKLYISDVNQGASSISNLYQFDLLATDISGSRISIQEFNTDTTQLLDLKIAPDNKIYLTGTYAGPGAYYPYHDTLYTMHNNNLSVINKPDSLGLSCDFQLYTLNLGTGRTYFGLPNNPDYELGPLVGSACDTLTGIKEIPGQVNFHAWFHSDWEILFVNADQLKGKNCTVNVYDLSGRLIKAQKGKPYSGYFTADVTLPGLSSGVYIVQLVTDKESVSGKFFKN